MNRMIVRSRIDTDGVLRVAVPVGRSDADREMQVIIEPAPRAGADDYAAWLDSIAGRWQGEFNPT